MNSLKKITSEEKRPIRIGAILIAMAIVLVIIVVKIDQIGEAASAIGKALTPFSIGIVIAYMLNVFVNFFETIAFQPLDKRIKSKKWPKHRRSLSILLSLVVILVIAYAAFSIIIPELAESVRRIFVTLQENGPTYYNDLRKWLEEFVRRSNLEIDLNLIFDKFQWESIFNNISRFSSNIISSIVNATVNVTSALFTGVISFIFSVYFLFGKEKLLRHLKALLYAYIPQKWAKRIHGVSSMTNHIFFQFVRGQLLECIILGCLCYVGMAIFQFKYAMLISTVMAITALVPIFGAYFGAIIGTVILLLDDPIRALWFLVFIIILQQLEGNLIYPKVVGHSIGLPAVWTMFAVMFWGALFGIPGILLGTPCTAVIYRLLRRDTNARLSEKGIDFEALEDGSVIIAGEK